MGGDWVRRTDGWCRCLRFTGRADAERFSPDCGLLYKRGRIAAFAHGVVGMAHWKIASVVLAALLAGCASSPGMERAASSDWIEPGQAVLGAAAAPREGVTGMFVMTVKATGRADEMMYLNSEEDYRDPRNLSIEVTPDAAAQLERGFGAQPSGALKGKRILVSGTARRTRIDFFVGNRPTGKYYYQTHVRVEQASQIQIL